MSETSLSPSSGSGAEPELRRVTVLFADIQGSTALIQDLEAEDAAGLLDPALQAMIEAAERFDGAVSHRGDGIMAVFGAPTVAEDHALRACLAALAMRDAMVAGGSGEVRLRIGIHAGEVVFRPVRIGGVLMHDAVGIAVHIAARLEQSAVAGEICLSGSAQAIAASYIRTEVLSALQVKGVDAPIPRFRLLGADPTANRWRIRAARGLSAFVGRGRELTALEVALGRKGLRAVQLVGPAGMGKSRLIHEFLHGPAAAACYVVTLTGDRHRRLAPFHPVTAWLRGWLEIRDADRLTEARAKLAVGLAGLSADADAALLERLLDLGDSAAALPRGKIDFGGAIAALIAALSGGRETILVCEDADSFDPATLELLESALPRLGRGGLLVLSASRGRMRISGIPAVAARSLVLAPLNDAEATTLLGGIDAGRAAEPALAAEILRKAGGNPLFLEEVAPLVSAAAPRGLDEASQPAIPDRVEELIADRLGRLAPELRRLVQLCAVIGPDVPARVIAPLSGLEMGELNGALRHLADEQLLYESRKYPDAQFTFKHALTRDVAYRTILVARRRLHHAAIVDILEAEGAEARGRNIEDLCHHALRAQRWEPAVSYLRASATAAMARTAYQSALAALRRAREVAAGLPAGNQTAQTRLDVLVALEHVVRWSGSYAELGTVLDEVEELALELGDRARVANVLATRVHMLNILGRLDEAIDLGERARVVAAADGDATLLMTASFYTGQSYFNVGRLGDAERVLSETLVRAEMAMPLRALCHGTRAMARALRGGFEAAAKDVAAAERDAAASGRAYDRIFAAAAAGFVAHERRRSGEAILAFRRALAISDEAGIVQLKPPALAGLGHAQLVDGDAAGASETLSAAYRLSHAEQRWMFQLFAAIGMAHAGIATGEPDLARGFAEEAVALAELHGFAAFRVPALRAHGMVLAATAGSEAAGHARLREALAAAEAASMAPEQAHAHAALAALAAPGSAVHHAEARARYADLGLGDCSARLAAAIASGRLPYL